VTEPEAGLFGIAVCGRNVLAVSETDAAAEGVEPALLAERWAARLREAWTAEKTRRYSRSLVEAAILGVLYPLLFLSLILVLRHLVRRLQRWIERVGRGKGLRVGPLHLTAEASDRGLLSRGFGFLGWAVYLFLTYVFLIAFFDRFPAPRFGRARCSRCFATSAGPRARRCSASCRDSWRCSCSSRSPAWCCAPWG